MHTIVDILFDHRLVNVRVTQPTSTSGWLGKIQKRLDSLVESGVLDFKGSEELMDEILMLSSEHMKVGFKEGLRTAYTFEHELQTTGNGIAHGIAYYPEEI